MYNNGLVKMIDYIYGFLKATEIFDLNFENARK